MDQVFVGTVVLPDRVIERGYVLVADGLIQKVGEGTPPSGEVHGGPDFFILPGAIDSQVHSRSQADQEDFIWSTKSAASGGVTAIVDMPYDDGLLIADRERFEIKRKEAAEQSRVDFALYATIDPEDGTRHIDDLVAAGAAAFKFSTFGNHPKRFPRIPPHLMYACFEAIGKHDLMVGVHNEDDETVRAAIEQVKQAGIDDYSAHSLSRPPIAEALATAQVFEIGAHTGCDAHIVHCSIDRGYRMAEAYRQQGYVSTIEACVHYLALNEEDDVRRLGGFGKVNPPIRKSDQTEALWRHLVAGNVTVVSTDHVSWSADRKEDPDIMKNAAGMPGLEALYPLVLKGLDQRGYDFTHAARVLAENPAKLFRLEGVKGALREGRDGDVVLARRDPYVYHAADSGANVVDWSAYEGMELPFRIDSAFLRGKAIMAEGEVLAQPGSGRFLVPGMASS